MSCGRICGYAGVWYKRIRRVPLVIEIRDVWPESMGAVGANIPKLAYWGLERIEQAMYRKCDKLVTVGEGYFARLAEKGIPKEKMSIVMNGTDLAVYSPREKNAELLKRYGFTVAAMSLADDSISLRDFKVSPDDKIALVMGTEGPGLPEETVRRCDLSVRIPMAHGVDSLNVAAASAVAFWSILSEGD